MSPRERTTRAIEGLAALLLAIPKQKREKLYQEYCAVEDAIGRGSDAMKLLDAVRRVILREYPQPTESQERFLGEIDRLVPRE